MSMKNKIKNFFYLDEYEEESPRERDGRFESQQTTSQPATVKKPTKERRVA